MSKSEFLKKYRYFRNLFRKFQLSQMHFSLKGFFNHLKDGDKKMAIKEIASLVVPSCFSGHFRKKILQFESGASNDRGNHLVSCYGDYWGGEYFEKKWFDSYIDIPFSDFNVKIPSGYREYLTQMFGDYMTPPPAEQQVGLHLINVVFGKY